MKDYLFHFPDNSTAISPWGAAGSSKSAADRAKGYFSAGSTSPLQQSHRLWAHHQSQVLLTSPPRAPINHRRKQWTRLRGSPGSPVRNKGRWVPETSYSTHRCLSQRQATHHGYEILVSFPALTLLSLPCLAPGSSILQGAASLPEIYTFWIPVSFWQFPERKSRCLGQTGKCMGEMITTGASIPVFSPGKTRQRRTVNKRLCWEHHTNHSWQNGTALTSRLVST